MKSSLTYLSIQPAHEKKPVAPNSYYVEKYKEIFQRIKQIVENFFEGVIAWFSPPSVDCTFSKSEHPVVEDSSVPREYILPRRSGLSDPQE